MTNEREKSGRMAAAKGFANESRLLGALLARGYNASRVDLPHSTYDIVVETDSELIRVQVKTASKSVSFIGGIRGGVDREYKSGVKEYVQSTETSDIVVGVWSDESKANGEHEINFYFVPTLYIETLKRNGKQQKSLSINKLRAAKNNWELLERCKDRAFILNFEFNPPSLRQRPLNEPRK